MSTRHLVDVELRPLLDALPQFVFRPDTLNDMRMLVAGMTPPPESYARPEVVVDIRQISGVRVVVYRPVNTTTSMPAVLHVHGGGYVMGTPEMAGPRNTLWAAELGVVVASVDYRLAPETPAPGALMDCYAVYRWMQDSAAQLGLDPARLALVGESAGGGLAAALALLIRDRGGVQPCFQLLVYPMLDDRTGSSEKPNPITGEFGWTAGMNRFAWSALIGENDVTPYVAAARSADLSGLPPTYIDVGALDLFLDEDMAYARRLAAAGVPVELHVYPGAFHGFDLFPGTALQQQAERLRQAALGRALGSHPAANFSI